MIISLITFMDSKYPQLQFYCICNNVQNGKARNLLTRVLHVLISQYGRYLSGTDNPVSSVFCKRVHIHMLHGSCNPDFCNFTYTWHKMHKDRCRPKTHIEKCNWVEVRWTWRPWNRANTANSFIRAMSIKNFVYWISAPPSSKHVVTTKEN